MYILNFDLAPGRIDEESLLRSDLLGPTTWPKPTSIPFRGELAAPSLHFVSCVLNIVFLGSSFTDVGRAGRERVPSCLLVSGPSIPPGSYGLIEGGELPN